MSSFPSNTFYLRINGYYLGIEESKNPLNQYRILCSEKKNESQLWGYKDKKIYHSQKGGYLTKKYHGWEPKQSNILLQTESDYEIVFEPLEWEYESKRFIANDQYILCKDSNHNIILQKKDESISPLISYEWEIILKI